MPETDGECDHCGRESMFRRTYPTNPTNWSACTVANRRRTTMTDDYWRTRGT